MRVKSLRAYAKLNIGLKIKEQRDDGYHNIESIFQKIDFFDEIRIEIRESRVLNLSSAKESKELIEFKTNTPPYGRENICYKAGELFFKHTGIKEGVCIELKKNVWISAGLGGGSSCGAAVLKGINDLFGDPLRLNRSKDLSLLCLELGSDCLFFLNGSCAFVRGRGEIVEEIPCIPMRFVLIYPKFEISSGWAYRNIQKSLTAQNDFNKLLTFWKKGDIKGLGESLFNDFEPLVMEKYPLLKEIKRRLTGVNLYGVSLTGSGSCIYGILDREYEIGFFDELFKDMDVEIRLAKSI